MFRFTSVLVALMLTASSAFARQGGGAQVLIPNPPKDAKVVSISLEDLPYPHPVHYLEMTLYGQDVRKYEKYILIHYGWTLSGDWPRLAKIRASLQQMVYQEPVVYDWPFVKVKTLVIGGEKDGPNYPALAKRTADTISGAQLHLIPNVGHNPHMEAPDLFYPPVLKFLKGM